MNSYVINTDASFKNGKAGLAFVVRLNQEPLTQHRARRPAPTSYVAEALALYWALQWILSNTSPRDQVTLHTDCQMLVKALTSPKGWPRLQRHGREFTHLLLLWQAAALRKRFSLQWVPRTQNKEADALSRKQPIYL